MGIKCFFDAGDVKNFLSCWFDEEFWSRAIAFVALMCISVGVQSLFFFVANWLPAAWHVGLILDALVFALIIVCVGGFGLSSNMFPFKGTGKKGAKYIVLMLVLFIVLYARIISDCSWLFFVSAFLLLVLCQIMLNKCQADNGFLSIIIGIPLIYCAGTYLALMVNGLPSDMSSIQFAILLVMTAVFWLLPSFE